MRGKLSKKAEVSAPIAISTSQPAESRELRRAVTRASILTFVVCSLGGFLASSFIYRSSVGKLKVSHQDQMKFAGKVIAKQVDLGLVGKVKRAEHQSSVAFKKLLSQAGLSTASDPRIANVSIVRLVDNKVRYVIDSRSESGNSGDKKDASSKPGDEFASTSKNLRLTLSKGIASVDAESNTTKLGDFVSSYTPLLKGKRVIGAVVVDMRPGYFQRDLSSVGSAFKSGIFATTGFALFLALCAGFYRRRIGLTTEQLSADFHSTSKKLNKTEEELVDAVKVANQANKSLVQTLWTSGCLIWDGTGSLQDDEFVWVGDVKFEPPFKWLADELKNGRSFDEVWREYKNEDDQATWQRIVTHAVRNNLPGTLVDYRINLENDRVLWFSEQLNFEYAEDQTVLISGFITDISEQRNKDEQVRKLAYYDTVTGLINRTKIHEHISELLRDKPKLSVIGIEISNFRNVNESWGPDIGDRLLYEVGNALKEGVGNFGVVGRLAGDDFVVIVPEEASIAWLVSKIDEVCQKPTVIDGVEVAKICRMGYVTADDGETAVGLIRKANLALEIARKNHATYPVPYKAEMSFKAKMRVELETAMRQALTDREFHLMFQPIICNKTKKVVKAEALLRWNSSRFGVVSPGTFIPIAEESDFINTLGNYVIDETARAISKLNEAIGQDEICISLNLSLRQLKNQSTLNSFSSALEKWNIGPKSMLIEITESSIMHDASEGTAMLDQLQDRGFSLAIDDFGTGYSSLSTLASLPFNCLKIDKKFVDGIGVDRKQEAVLATIVRLARALNLQIVAEGIEQEAQFHFLRDLDVEFSQGFYFAKPLPFEDLMAMVLESHAAAA